MRDEDGNESDDFKAARIAAAHIGSTHHKLAYTEDDYYEALHRVIHKLESLILPWFDVLCPVTSLVNWQQNMSPWFLPVKGRMNFLQATTT